MTKKRNMRLVASAFILALVMALSPILVIAQSFYESTPLLPPIYEADYYEYQDEPEIPDYEDYYYSYDYYASDDEAETIQTPDFEYPDFEWGFALEPDTAGELSVGRGTHSMPANIDALEPEYLEARSMIAALSTNGIHFTQSGFITFQGQQRLYGPIAVWPNEVIHVQATMPNSAAIDYDLYLFRLDALGNLILVDLSEYDTLINGNFGTIPEAVGAVNTTTLIQNYVIMIASFRGSSATMPYTLHVGINNRRDMQETDENAFQATPLNFSPTTGVIVNTRSMDTMTDNDWFRFDVPANRDFDQVSITLDATSNSALHRVELYTMTNTGGMRKIVPTGSTFNVSAGSHFVRVTALASAGLTNVNYTLTITPLAGTSVPPGSTPETAVLLNFFRENQTGNPARANIAIGQTLPNYRFYYRFMGSSPTTITMISPHEGLRFAIYDYNDYLLLGPNAPRIYDSHTGAVNSWVNIRSADRGTTTPLNFNGIQIGGHIQKLNGNDLDRLPRWHAGSWYLIVVYVHPLFRDTTVPVGNGGEFAISAGNGMRGGTGNINNVVHNMPFMWTANGMRVSGSVNVMPLSRNGRLHPNTARVTEVNLHPSDFAWSRWSLRLENFRDSRSLLTRNGNAVPARGWVTIPHTNRPLMDGNWLITIEATHANHSTIGHGRPTLSFTYVFELGD